MSNDWREAARDSDESILVIRDAAYCRDCAETLYDVAGEAGGEDKRRVLEHKCATSRDPEHP